MKKFLFLLMTATLLSVNAYAKHGCKCDNCPCALGSKGGFVEEAAANTPAMKVSDVKKQKEDTYVAMKGNIVKRINKDSYDFTDGADNITVQIDKDVWRGQMISPKDTVIIYGEVDEEGDGVIVEVETIQIVD